MITEGKDTVKIGIPRQSIATGNKIPNAAIFVKRTALEFLQIIFASRPAGEIRYDPNESITEIQISDLHAVNLEAVNLRPAIVAARGPQSWQGSGLGGSSIEGRTIATGATIYNDTLVGSVAFSCVSREGIEAEQIAHIVFNSFKFLRKPLQEYGFLSLKSVNIGGEILIESEGSDDKTTIVPVYVTAMVQDRWSLVEKAGRTLRDVITENLPNV